MRKNRGKTILFAMVLDRNITFANKVHFTSLGCARNLVDSEVMIGILLKTGYEMVSCIEDADFCIINTCGFLEAARQEALDVIGEVFSEMKSTCKVVVAGCMVQKHSELLKKHFPNIHYLLGSGDVEKILDAVSAKNQGSSVTTARSFLEWGEVPRVQSTPKHYAYLKIAEGCKKRCAFCIIPTIKGPLKSKTNEQVLKEFKTLLDRGVFEVILIAQDLGDYGKDRKEKGALAALLREILKEKRNFWLRLLYLYPDEINDDLIAIMQSDSRICNYLDMPIQHINDQMLKAMHRKTSRSQITDIIEKLRSKIPDVVIRTSLMVGFPGETDEQFEELIKFVQDYPLDNVGIFTFSLEKEAYAAKLPNQIPEKIKQCRFKELNSIQLEMVQARNAQYIGKVLPAIVEGYHPETELLLQARHSGQCPDIDGQIIINDAGPIDAFEKFFNIEITDFSDYDLIGKAISPLDIHTKKDRLALV